MDKTNLQTGMGAAICMYNMDRHSTQRQLGAVICTCIYGQDYYLNAHESSHVYSELSLRLAYLDIV